MKKKIIASLAVMALSLTLASCADAQTADTQKPPQSSASTAVKIPEGGLKEATDGIFKFRPNDDGVSYKVALIDSVHDESLIYPGSYNGIPVTRVESPLSFFTEIRSTKIILSEGIESVAPMALGETTALKSISFPSTLKSISGKAFSYRPGDFTITMEKEGEFFCVRGNCLIEKAGGTVAIGCASSVIPDDGSIKAIGHDAFRFSTFKTLSLPSSVKEIGTYAFSDCQSLDEIDLSFVESLDEGVFARCKALKKVVLTEKIRFIGEHAFAYCESLAEIDVPKGTVVGNYTFDGCISLPGYSHSLGYYVHPDKKYYVVSGIGSPTDEKITIPAKYNGYSVKEIGKSALASIAITSTVYISDGIAVINDGALKGSLPQNVRLPSTLEFFGENVFSESEDAKYNEYEGAIYTGNEENPYLVLVKSLHKKESMTVHKDTKVIAVKAFKDDGVIKALELPEGLVGIGTEAFSGCKLEELCIPSTLKTFDTESFFMCESVKTIRFAEGTKKLPDNALYRMPRLSQIYLPSTIQRIGYSIFSDTLYPSLIQIHYGGTAAEWNAMKKSYNWNNSDKPVTVICTDETISIPKSQ